MPPEAEPRVRPAATVVLIRQGAKGPEVLMGMRGAAAVFMPSKYVFPGGAVDPGDAAVPLATPLPPACAARLGAEATALAAAAIRELWEETGLALGQPGTWQAPPDWQSFAARGLIPDAAALRFIFRAFTPPGRPRRFDAHFFLAEARHIAGDPEDFSAASDELSHLHWIGLAEVSALLRDGDAGQGVPFFDNSGNAPIFRRLT